MAPAAARACQFRVIAACSRGHGHGPVIMMISRNVDGGPPGGGSGSLSLAVTVTVPATAQSAGAAAGTARQRGGPPAAAAVTGSTVPDCHWPRPQYHGH